MSRTLPTGPRAAALRRELGPVAWCALECMLERSDDGHTTTASVRAVAGDLGVAKNTAHRAIAALVRAGLVAPIQARDVNGRFQPGSYRLRLDDLPAPSAPTPTTRPRRRVTATAPPAQLSLLPSA